MLSDYEQENFPELVELDCKSGTLEEYRALVLVKDCRCCGRRLRKRLTHYDHDGGFRVAGFSNPQWLYFECGCGNQEALWKALSRSQAYLLRQYDDAVFLSCGQKWGTP